MTPAPDPFVLGEDHELLRSTVRRLGRDHFSDGYLRRALGRSYPHEELRRLAGAGLCGILVSPLDGGQGADPLALGIACEEIGYADMAVAYALFGANLATDVLAATGTAAAKDRWLAPLLAGGAVGALALTEPGAGSDAAALRTTATRVGGGWILDGEKTSVTQATHADVAIVFARSQSESGFGGVSAFIVPIHDPSVTVRTFEDPGLRALGRGSITFDGTLVTEDDLLGVPEAAFKSVMREFDLTRPLIGLMVVGAAQRALDLTAEYVTSRQAFGRPVSRFQGVSFPLAEHTTMVETARLLAYRTLGLRGAGLPHTREAAMVKWWAPEVAFQAIKDCIVLHGHVGWSDELPLQALLRDVSAYFIGDGTPQIQKLIVARSVLGRDAVEL